MLLKKAMQCMGLLVCLQVAAWSSDVEPPVVYAQSDTDWPVYMQNNGRTGISSDDFSPEEAVLWTYIPRQKPARGRYIRERENTLGPLKIRNQTVTNDYAFAPVISEGKVYFASSSEETLFCLDLLTGKTLWEFTAQGSIRFAPAVSGSLVLVGSDDGHMYAVDKHNGKMVWVYDAAPEQRSIVANARMASQWPIRTGVTIDNGIAYFSSGLFPANGGVFLHAVRVSDGSQLWKVTTPLPAQGYILAADNSLLVPNGRGNPGEYAMSDGSSLLGKLDTRREGGSTFLAVLNNMVYYGPNVAGVLRIRVTREGMADTASATRSIRGLVMGLQAWRAVSVDKTVYLLTGKELLAVPQTDFYNAAYQSAAQSKQRVKGRFMSFKSGVQLSGDKRAFADIQEKQQWTTAVADGRSLISVGTYLIVGGKNVVQVFDRATGALKHSYDVDGQVWELAATGGKVIASTESGNIYCFGQGTVVPTTAPQPQETNTESPAIVSALLEKTWRRKGYVLLLDMHDVTMALSLSQQSDFQIVCVERSAAAVEDMRTQLKALGCYGQVVVHHYPEEKLPFSDYLFNGIISSAEAGDRNEIRRVLHPYGGVWISPSTATEKSDFYQWSAGPNDTAICVRTGMESAGQWSHMYGDLENTSCSGDSLVKGKEYRVQWFAPVGMDANSGYHSNGMGPLYNNGFMALLKVEHIEMVDAYNGTSLWKKDIKGASRFNPAREGGSACMDDRFLYLTVGNSCQVLDQRTGALIHTYTIEKAQSDWGYIAVWEDTLIGTRQSVDATFVHRGTKSFHMWKFSEAEFAFSRELFALHKETGADIWRYNADTKAILNSSITISTDEKRIYFIENRSEKIAQEKDDAVLLGDYTASDCFLVCLDMKTGEPVYEAPFHFPTRTVFYLSYEQGQLICTGGVHEGGIGDIGPTDLAAAKLAKKYKTDKKNIMETKMVYVFQSIDATTGTVQWNARYTSNGFLANQHNYSIGHPVITKDKIYSFPGEQHLAIIDLKTGEVTAKPEHNRKKGCSIPTGSNHTLFFRSGRIEGYDMTTDSVFTASQVNRPSCWMNVLPAGGLVLMPEYSLGCNCAYPIMTSIVLVPVAQ